MAAVKNFFFVTCGTVLSTEVMKTLLFKCERGGQAQAYFYVSGKQLEKSFPIGRKGTPIPQLGLFCLSKLNFPSFSEEKM